MIKRILLLCAVTCSAALAQLPACTTSATLQLNEPADNVTTATPVTFSWTAVTGASAYRVWVIVDGAPATVLDRTTNTTATDAVPSGAIEWYVEVLFGQCPSIFSTHRHFTVATGATCGTRKPPAPLSPVNGVSVASPVTFTWTAVQNALLYRLWISIDGSPFVDVDESRLTTLTEDVAAGNIQWYVDAVTEGCAPIASATAAFVIPQTSACTTAAPFTVAPVDGSTSITAPVTFSWTPVANATAYRIIASVDGGDFFLLGKSTSTSLTRFIPPGAWVWIVEAVFDECPSTRSAKSRFTIVKAANCPTAGLQLIAPADKAPSVTSPVTFTWTSVPGASVYVVFARHNDGSVTAIGQTTATQLEKKLPDGTFEWFVAALFASCPPLESVRNTFTIPVVCDSARPVLIVPHDDAVGLTSPVQFAWSRTPGARSYNLWIASGDNAPVLAGSTTDNKITASVAPGPTSWRVEAVFPSCPSTESATADFVARAAPPCGTPQRPLVRVPGQAASGSAYAIRWTAVPNASSYELQEATFGDFRNATTQVISDVVAPLTHTTTQPARYFYRVRAISNCSDARGAYSKIASAVVLPPSRSATVDVDATTGPTQTIVLPGRTPATTFTAKADKPWITITPASGPIGASGATLTVTSDRNALRNGSNKASIAITYAAAMVSGRLAPFGTNTTSVPISVTVAAPVAPGGKNTPPPDSLIVPAVAHAGGMNGSSYVSDVRLANVSPDVMRYQLNFTLSRTDGTQFGQSTTVEVDPGSTLALDDILSTFFGQGPDGGNAAGQLEIRTLSSSSSSSSTTASVTIASSRTFDTTSAGTFGEFIPAIPFSQFIASGSPRISMQHLAQNAAFRTNLGLIEAAGENANVLIHVFNDSGNELAQIPFALLPGEHRQLNSFLQANNISLPDARIEIEVTSSTGKVSAYASVVDNSSNDAYIVTPFSKSAPSSTHFVLPDAEVNAGTGKRTDVRLFNAGASAVTATLAYPGSPNMQVTIAAGQVKAIDNVLQAMNLTTAAGALSITTSSAANLSVTGRTYTQTATGTIGQFVPAVLPSQAVGAGERTMQLLQLEDSDQFRATVGIAETSGKAATVEISVITPDAKAIPKVQFTLDPNASMQVPVAGFGLGNIYNARVTVKVISGSGRVTAYGSVVDQQSLDPTYVPAQ